MAHLLLAGLLWTSVGIGLLAAGVHWLLPLGEASHGSLLALALVAGALKGRFVLDRTARRNVERIIARGDGRCLGGFLSWQSWLLAAGMMLLGRLLRHGPIPRPALGIIYAAVGTALLIGGFRIWAGRRRFGRATADRLTAEPEGGGPNHVTPIS